MQFSLILEREKVVRKKVLEIVGFGYFLFAVMKVLFTEEILIIW